jgi:DNA-binding PadR family transcriptional regulator
MRHSPERERPPEDLLPLTAALYHFLLALVDGDKHGYAVLKEVSRRTGGRVRLSAGTLYGIVKRSLDEGLIEESAERPDPSLDDERRRYYRLTDYGRRVARAHAERLEEEVRMARDKRLLPRLGRAR